MKPLLLPRRDSTHKVGTTECSGDENGYPSTIWSLNADISTDMREYLFMTHGLQCQFTPIAVSGDCDQRLADAVMSEGIGTYSRLECAELVRAVCTLRIHRLSSHRSAPVDRDECRLQVPVERDFSKYPMNCPLRRRISNDSGQASV